MKPVTRFFTEHPASVDESYGEHFFVATGFGAKMVVAGAACMIHGVLPFLFERTGSKAVHDLHETMIDKRNRKNAMRAQRAQAYVASHPHAADRDPRFATFIDVGLAI